MSLERAIAELRQIDPDLDAIDIADALWLARHLDRPAVGGAPAPAPLASIDRPSATTTAEPPIHGDRAPPSVTARKMMTDPLSATLFAAREPTASGSAVKVADLPALAEALALGRALRPLKRRVESRRGHPILDESETARLGAAARFAWLHAPILPVFRPPQERWLDAVLLVDRSQTMAVWRRKLEEWEFVLRRLGAFGDINVWHLAPGADARTPVLASPTGGEDHPWLHRSVAELADPRGRRLVMIATDCLGPLWRSDVFLRWLSESATAGLVAILHVMPQHLWRRTELAGCDAFTLRATSAGQPTNLLQATAEDDETVDTATVALPVIAFEPHTMLTWSRLLLGHPQGAVPGYRFDVEGAPVVASGAAPSDVHERFVANSSSVSRQLAAHLAAVPLTEPVIRLVRRLVPRADESHLCEILFSGIVKQTSADLWSALPGDELYDFQPGARDRLLATLPSGTVESIARRIGAELERSHGAEFNFAAVLGRAQDGAVDLSKRPFASVSRALRDRLTPTTIRRRPAPSKPIIPAEDPLRQVGWLHLSSLLVRQEDDEFRLPHLKMLQDRLRSLDLIFITGDVALSGEPAEFQKALKLCSQLQEAARTLTGRRPHLLSVPGNHDRQWSEENRAAFAEIRHSPDLRDDFYANAEHPLRQAAARMFGAYTSWADEVVDLPLQRGILPGDFSTSVEVSGIRLGIVGLNTEALGGPKPSIDVRQLAHACGEVPAEWLARNDLTILLTHHPLDGVMELRIASLFDIHLCGGGRSGSSLRRRTPLTTWQASSDLTDPDRLDAARIRHLDIGEVQWIGRSRMARFSSCTRKGDEWDLAAPIEVDLRPPRMPQSALVRFQVIERLEALAFNVEHDTNESRWARGAVDAPRSLTAAYCKLAIAHALARMQEFGRAVSLVDQASNDLDPLDPVHSLLARAYAERVDDVVAGRPTGLPLSNELRAQRERLERMSRYKVDRVFQASHVLEPFARVDPYATFGKGSHDRLPLERWSREEAESIATAVEALLRSAPSEEIFRHILDYFPCVDVRRREGVQRRLLQALRRLPAKGRLGATGKLIAVSGQFRDRRFLGSAWQFFNDCMGKATSEETYRELPGVIRSLRFNGMVNALSSLGALEAGSADTADRGMLIAIASARACTGHFEPRRFEEAFSFVEGSEVSPADRLTLARSLAQALAATPADFAFSGLARMEKLLSRLTDSYITNTHLGLSRLEHVESIALGYTDMLG